METPPYHICNLQKFLKCHFYLAKNCNGKTNLLFISRSVIIRLPFTPLIWSESQTTDLSIKLSSPEQQPDCVRLLHRHQPDLRRVHTQTSVVFCGFFRCFGAFRQSACQVEVLFQLPAEHSLRASVPWLPPRGASATPRRRRSRHLSHCLKDMLALS